MFAIKASMGRQTMRDKQEVDEDLQEGSSTSSSNS